MAIGEAAIQVIAKELIQLEEKKHKAKLDAFGDAYYPPECYGLVNTGYELLAEVNRLQKERETMEEKTWKAPETFWEGFLATWGFLTFWMRVKPSAPILGGVVSVLIYCGIVLIVFDQFWRWFYDS